MTRDDDTPTGPPPDATGSTVAGKVRSGLVWSLLNNVVLRLGALISGIVLARILTPEDFGVYAIALTVLTLLQSANELGVSLALVQRPGDVREIAPTVMTIAIGSSVLMYAITFASAPALAAWMDAPDAADVVRLMCLGVVLDGIVTVPLGILNRFFLQRRLFIGEAVAFTGTTAVTIALAATGAGAFAFAWGVVAGNTLGAVVHTCLAPIRVRPGWNRRVVPSLLRFGLPLAGASLLMLSVVNLDNLVVGAVLGQVLLGYYLLAFRQSNWPLVLFSEAARRVALAGFSRLIDDRETLSRAFARSLGLLMAATIPTGVLVAAYAEPLIRVLYGEQWVPAARALPLLVVFGILRVGLFVAYDLFVALGRARLLAWLQLLWLLVVVPALALGAEIDGIRGAAAAHALVAGLIVTPAFLVVLKRLGVAPGQALVACWRPALGGLVIALSAWFTKAFVQRDVALLVVGAATAVVMYLPIVWPMRRLVPRRSAPDAVPVLANPTPDPSP